MVNITKILLPLTTILSISYANTIKYNVEDLTKNIDVPAKYILQDLEAIKNDPSITFDKLVYLVHKSNEVIDMVNDSEG